VTGGVGRPADGQADPTGIAVAPARGARQRGATIREGDNVRVAAGFSPIVVRRAGKALAQWSEDGEEPFGPAGMDIARTHERQGNRLYPEWRATGTLGLLYAGDFPCRQVETARGVRRSPVPAQLLAHGAVMGTGLASSCELSRPPTSPTWPTPSARRGR
jgi:hypothetical protein